MKAIIDILNESTNKSHAIEENGYLSGVSFHHDCPTGSWFVIEGM